MMRFLVFLFTIYSLFAEEFYDLKREGYEQYQDIYVQGRVIEKASYAERYEDARYANVNRVLSRYRRPFSVLDIGAAQGYFCFRGAEEYRDSVFVMLEGSNAVYPLISKQLFSICQLNKHLNNVAWLNRPIVVEEVETLSKLEHFDVVLLLNILHWFPNQWKTLLEAVKRMSDVTIIELPPMEEGLSSEQKEARCSLHAYLATIAKETLEGVPRHTNLSLSTIYYILENEKIDYEMGERLPGIKQTTYLMFNGSFPILKKMQESGIFTVGAPDLN